MQTPTQRQVTSGYVVEAAATAFGDHVAVSHLESLSGSFGSVWRVDLADGRRTALKIGPIRVPAC